MPKSSSRSATRKSAKPAAKGAKRAVAAKPAKSPTRKSTTVTQTATPKKAAQKSPPQAAKAVKPPVAASPQARGRKAKEAATAPAIAPQAAAPAIPAPKPLSARPIVQASEQDIAAATEYLLTRSATRSSAPVIVNGKKLPTEEQLLKMPEDQYMNEDQLAFFKYRLEQIEKELMANADETTEHLRETVIVPDPADRATIEEEHALELRTRDRERKLLKKVKSSLASIEAGEYGYCEETGEPIGIARLLARPTATLSLEAQQRREIKQKLFGD
ncbi:MAG TPA: RNA polymerase-binding protein DksA [Burkholderiaceae bacterium]|nr:RNA polymerase-binding protein DksA [Burkholderiaceae bacterium]